jgi:endoglucanase Acf2
MPRDSPIGIEVISCHLIPGASQYRKGYISIDENEDSPSDVEKNKFENDLNQSDSSRYKTVGIRGIIISCFVFIFGLLFFGERTDRLGQILNRTTAFKPVTHADLPTALWGVVAKPYPTGAFWTNLVVKNGDGAIGVYPYGVKTIDAGVQVSYGASRRLVTPIAIADIFVPDLQISAVQGYISRGVEAYDNTSVTMGYKTAVNGRYRTHLVKGSPFITVVYENATPIISSALMKINSVDARVVRGSVGIQYIVTLGNFQKWLVYCSEPVALIWRDNTLYSPNPIKGFMRVSILPIQNAEVAFNMLLGYVQKYATGAVMTLGYPSGMHIYIYMYECVHIKIDVCIFKHV